MTMGRFQPKPLRGVRGRNEAPGWAREYFPNPCVCTNASPLGPRSEFLGAVLDHYKLQCESNEAYHTSATNLVASRGANCSRHCINAGGALVRDEVVAALAGEDAKCTLNGLYMADGERLVDNHTTILHMMQRCRSHQVYDGVLAGHARGVFDGKIAVGPEANQSDAKQINRTYCYRKVPGSIRQSIS